MKVNAIAIVLAIELNADLLIIDEKLGRKVASSHKLLFTGILGVLIEGKRQALIPTVKSLLDDLIWRAGFWVKEPLYNRVIEIVDE